jgi:hypothetical protein
MKNNLWVRISRYIYARLLNLYPKAHRNEYGPDMLQVFTDECKACFQERKGFKLLPLWLRTLGDLIVNVVKEHISDPQSSVGLMEAAPNSPLPWKGVLLVLVPGLIFFVSQVALLINGKDWFAWMSRRAAYVLIVPVLVVWIWKRKFPIWGLVPLGLLFSTFLTSFWYHFEVLGVNFNTNSIIVWMNERTQGLFTYSINKALAIVFLLCAIGLLWFLKKRSSVSKSAWIWLGVYGLLVILIYWVGYGFQMDATQNLPVNFLHTILVIAYFGFYSYGGYLVLILLGTFLAKRHGKLTILLLLGFLLPTITYSANWSIMVYRFLVALVAPIWIMRSATGKMQRRAGVISIAALLIFQFIIGESYGNVTVIIDQLIMAAGLALAIALYGKIPDTQNTQPEMDIILERSSIHNS